MGSDVPKQYLYLGNYPVIYYCLKVFENSRVDEVILVTSESDRKYCQTEIVEKYGLQKVKQIVSGGAERYDSVYNGLQKVGDDVDYVLIHDAARPLINNALIDSLLCEVQKEGACVPAVPITDTIKVADENGYAKFTPDRNTLWSIQTPQVFETSLIKEAYSKIYQASSDIKITDDAMVVETFTKHKIKLVMGEYNNMKITTSGDLVIADHLLHLQE